MKPTLGSLFAGIGGIDLGFERAGFETVWQVEINEYCRKVLARHFPNAERYDDVRTVGKHNLRPVDVIAGGFPCQDISNAGNQAGIDEGERSGLWREQHRIISLLRPSFAFMENVAALLGRGMARVIGDLAAIGYDAEWQVIPAKELGALHLRERVWIVAYPQAQRFEEARELRCVESQERISSRGQARIFTDDWKKRVQGKQSKTLSGEHGFSWCQDVRGLEDLRGRSDIPEPLFRGSRDGIPDWVDRIGAIGNAVVPQIPELIANRIRECLEAA